MDQIERPWSPEEDDMLINFILKHGSNWSLVSKSIPGKSDQSCMLRWWFLDRPFTPEEDEMLKNLFDKHSRNWSLISKSIPGRSAMLCELRWLSLTSSFTPDEDEMLQNLIEKYGPNWSLISKSIPGKSAMTCWSRWLSLFRSFMPDEDEMLLNLFEKHGRNWSLISKSIPGKSDKTCELRWDTVWNSKTNEDITIGGQGSSYTHHGILRHEVGGVSRQPPSISDFLRGNTSSGGMHFYCSDQSAPSWNALNKRESSLMMIEGHDDVQEFTGGDFGLKDSSEVSSIFTVAPL